MSDPNDPPTLESIDARLKAAQDAGAEKQKAGFRQRENSRGMGLGMRIGIELVVSVLAGGGIGLFIDTKLNTKPIFMLALLVLGFTAGVLNVLRLTKGLDQAVGLGRAIRDKEDAGTNGDEAGENNTKAPE
jgi:ATP synthase protein I